jgi:hypothetical protein
MVSAEQNLGNRDTSPLLRFGEVGILQISLIVMRLLGK